MALASLALRIIGARPLRSLLTILGVALGVGVLGASLTLGAGLDAAIDGTVRDLVGTADLRVSAFLERGLSDATVEAIRSTDGVAAVAPAVERRTFLGAPAGEAGGAVTVVGVDPVSDARVHPLDLTSGSPLVRPDEASALISQRLATDGGYALGAELTIQGIGAPAHVRIIGIFAGSGPVADAAGRTVIVPIDIARATFGLSGVTRVDIGLTPGTRAPDVAARLADRITSEPYVLSTPSDLAAGLRASTADFQATTAWLSVIVLFVGAFLIINTISMTVGERAREVGLLRAAGATRRQILRFVLAGAAILGTVGSLLGLAIGACLGVLVASSVSALTGFAARVEGLNLDSLTLAFLVGFSITIAAAIEPALRASRIPPVEALRAQLDVTGVRRGRLLWSAAVLVFVVVLAILLWPPAAGTLGADRALVVYGAMLVATFAVPFVLPPLARLVGIPLSLALRLEERLARGSLARDRSRTALTLGALVIGLAMVVALGWTAQASRSRAAAWLVDVVPGDEVLSSIPRIALDSPLIDDLRATPGVRSITPIGTFDLAARGERIDAAAIVGADFLADGRLTFTAGDRVSALSALDDGGTAIVPAAVADRLGLHVGDVINLAMGDGTTLGLRIDGIVDRSIPSGGGEAILVGWPDAVSSIGVTGANVLAVRFIPGASPVQRSDLEAKAAGYALEASPLDRIQGAVSEALGRVFGLFDALALIALLVAGLGIVNTLGIGVLERVREIGVLRAIGMTSGQASRMVVTEGFVVGVVGTILGTLVGLAIGAILLILDGNPGAIDALPWGSIAAATVLGLAASIVASYYPARLASRVSIIAAVTYT